MYTHASDNSTIRNQQLLSSLPRDESNEADSTLCTPTTHMSEDNFVLVVQPANSSHLCALEKSLYAYSTRTTETIVCLSIGTSFNTVTEAYDFYNLYS